MTETATVSPMHETPDDPDVERAKVALAAEREGYQAQRAKLADLEYVRDRYSKRGARMADRAFDRKVEQLRAQLSQ